MQISIDVEKLAHELIDSDGENGAAYLSAMSESCEAECKSVAVKGGWPEHAKLFDAYAAGYKRAAEIVRAM